MAKYKYPALGEKFLLRFAHNHFSGCTGSLLGRSKLALICLFETLNTVMMAPLWVVSAIAFGKSIEICGTMWRQKCKTINSRYSLVVTHPNY